MPVTRLAAAQPVTTQVLEASRKVQPSRPSHGAGAVELGAQGCRRWKSRATTVEISPSPWRPPLISFCTRVAP